MTDATINRGFGKSVGAASGRDSVGGPAVSNIAVSAKALTRVPVGSSAKHQVIKRPASAVAVRMDTRPEVPRHDAVFDLQVERPTPKAAAAASVPPSFEVRRFRIISLKKRAVDWLPAVGSTEPDTTSGNTVPRGAPDVEASKAVGVDGPDAERPGGSTPPPPPPSTRHVLQEEPWDGHSYNSSVLLGCILSELGAFFAAHQIKVDPSLLHGGKISYTQVAAAMEFYVAGLPSVNGRHGFQKDAIRKAFTNARKHYAHLRALIDEMREK